MLNVQVFQIILHYEEGGTSRQGPREGQKLPEWVIEEKLKRLTVRPKVMGVPATPASCTCTCTFVYVYSIEDLFNEDADAREDMKF